MSKSLKILIVDDNTEFCRNVVDIVELKGYQAAVAHDGQQAIELVKQENFDLVLMDIKMPMMNGVDTFKKIKEINSDIPVIMVTAFAVEELIREALREGAFGVVRKPFDFDDLFERIERAQDNGGLILVVDDDQDICANLKDVLTGNNYQVSIANNSEDALEKTRQNNFDLILLDMQLPPLNGLETYLAIRDIRPNVTVVLITGYFDEMRKPALQAVERNAYTCLEKPIDMDGLMEMMEYIRDQKEKGIAPEKPGWQGS